MHVKTDDDVLITAGKDRGFTGEVIEADPESRQVKVARRNMIVKHKQPNPVTGDDGARVEKEGWIDASNVSLYVEDEEGDYQPVRVGHQFVGKDGELYEDKPAAKASFEGDPPAVIHKVRVAKQTGDVIDEVPSYS
ncbi:MAG: 50S ribosomal protein L24 [Bradymonadaceae bacterium]